MKRADKIIVLIGGAFVSVFGLLVLGGCLYLLIDEIQRVQLIRSAQTWPEVQAYVVYVDRDVSYSSKGVKHDRLKCRYRYSYEGQEYHGDEIGLQGDTAEIGHWKDELSLQLIQAEGEGTPIPCYVDPRQPSRAVLSRTFRAADFWTSLWLWFGGACFGIFMLSVSFYVFRQRLQSGRLEAAHPGQPWLWKSEWRGDGLKPQANAAPWLWAAIIPFTVEAVTIALFVVPVLREEGGSFQAYFVAIAGLALPVILLAAAIVTTMRGRGLRGGRLHLETMPVCLGRELRGQLVLPAGSRTEGLVHVELERIRKVVVGKNTRTDRQIMARQAVDGGARLEASGFATFKIVIPTEKSWPSRDESVPHDRTTWELRVRFGQGWLRPRLIFDMPVYDAPAGGEHKAS